MSRAVPRIRGLVGRLRRARAVRWLAVRLPPGARRWIARLLAGAPRPGGDARAGSGRGANVIGHFRGEFGMAEAARSLVSAAQAAGVPVALVSARSSDARGRDLRYAGAIGTEAPYPINVICVNANETAQLMDELGSRVTGGRYNVGFWFWELGRLPAAWLGAVERVDEIWVASEFVRATMAAATSKPVATVRLAVDATPSRVYERSEFGLADDAFTFLFTFSFNSYMARKNPLGTISAFRKAFPRGERVALVLKSMHGGARPEQSLALEQAIGGDERIRVIDQLMPRDEVFGLESVVDAYVSLHRSEGFGLGLAESMFLGKPVIGTAYSGNLEFMDSSNSGLVGYRLVEVGAGEYPFPDGQVWAEPDEEEAAALMRRLVDDRAFGRELGDRARAHMLEHFSPTAVGTRIAERVSRILESGR